MRNILVLNAGITPDSISRQLVQAAVARLPPPDAVVVVRDLAAQPIPHLTLETLAGVVGAPATEAERRARALSDALIAELRAADVIVIGAPMYNFGLPTVLRAWFDHVMRAGETFAYADGAVRGLLVGKRAIVVSTRGGRYADGAGAASDFQEPYVLRLLAFMGITDVEVVRAEGLALGPPERVAAIDGALGRIEALEAGVLAPAA